MPKNDLHFPPSALEHFDEIFAAVRDRPALFLDYDGTLAPIAPRPEQALPSQPVRRVLERLSGLCPVAIASGRKLSELRAMVLLRNVTYVGSHGFEIETPDGWTPADLRPERFASTLGKARRELEEAVRSLPGVFVETKPISLALHYRLASPADAARAAEAFRRVASAYPEFRTLEGKRVFELLPRIEWDKGRAVLALAERLRRRDPAIVPVYLGDDITDEDAFRALRESGIGIAVLEEPKFTDARYSLADTEEVRRFLENLASRLRPGA